MSKDVRPLEVYSCDLLVDGKQVAFVVSDHDKNILVYIYDPEGNEIHVYVQIYPTVIVVVLDVFNINPRPRL